MKLYRYVDERSSGWMTVSGPDDHAPEAPWRPATGRETLRWVLTAERYSLVSMVVIFSVAAVVQLALGLWR